ncbi:hypothetical protein HBB16_09900 [Pseudonocardia sp. MCCB 268]|nr:hypothetical protein [Pseudonocardia cytotoxica]
MHMIHIRATRVAGIALVAVATVTMLTASATKRRRANHRNRLVPPCRRRSHCPPRPARPVRRAQARSC